MKNLILLPHIRGKIEARVDRVLRDLDNPTPPLRVEDVRELLKLDLAYYTGEKDGFLTETIHRLRVAGKQVIARPTLVLDAIRKFSLKALYAPDRRRILIDENVPKPKHRWIQGHEIVHEILDWHLPVLRGDDELSLKQSCLAKVEAEANYGGGQLLFLRATLPRGFWTPRHQSSWCAISLKRSRTLTRVLFGVWLKRLVLNGRCSACCTTTQICLSRPKSLTQRAPVATLYSPMHSRSNSRTSQNARFTI